MARSAPSKRNQRTRKPRQARARATVTAILGGAARVLSQRGHAGASTNHIAHAAGVSIGSVYEYFPDKAAIFTALHHDHLDETEAALREALDELEAERAKGTPPLDAMIRRLVEATVEIHARTPDLHHRLASEVPAHASVRDRVAAFELELGARVVALLAEHPEVRAPDLIVAVTVSLQAVEALVHRWVAIQRQPDAAALASSELVRLVGAYLRASPPDNPG